MNNLYLRAIRATVVGTVAFFAVIFIPAGTLDYWQGWVFVGTLSVSSIARRVASRQSFRAAWLRPKQTDLVPDKGQFRSRFHQPLSYCCPTTIFRDPRNRHRHHLSATLLDGRAGNGWARLLRCGRDRSGGGLPNAGYEPHQSCGDCPLTGSEPAKKSGQNIPKNRCRTTIAERLVETRAELPFIGDQVGLFRAQPGRPK